MKSLREQSDNLWQVWEMTLLGSDTAKIWVESVGGGEGVFNVIIQ